MSGLVKAFEPLMKVAARTYQGMLSSELNKMGKLDSRVYRVVPIDPLPKLFWSFGEGRSTILHREQQ